MILPLTSGTNNGGQSGRLIAKEETQDELELTSHKLVRNLIRIFIPDSEKMFTYLFIIRMKNIHRAYRSL